MGRRLHLCLWTIALWALLAEPALAEGDPFRDAAPPTPVAPKPAPQPQPQPQPREEPAPVAPQLPSARFSADYVSRIKQAAMTQQLGVPDAIVIREESTPAAYRNYLGAWGPGAWSNGLRYLVVVQAVDAEGNVDLVRSWGNSPQGYFKLGWEKARGKLAGGKLVFDFEYGGTDSPGGKKVQHAFALAADNTLHGSSSASAIQIDLSRLQ